MVYTNDDIQCSSEAYLQVILPYISEIVLYLNANYQIIECNSAAERFYDFPKAEILGAIFFSFCQQNNNNFRDELINLETAKKITSTITSKAGQHRSANWQIFSLNNAKNQIAQYVVIGTESAFDIVKQIEIIADFLPGNYWWKDVSGRYFGCNNATAKLLGLKSKAEIVGKTDHEMPWSQYADELVKNDKEVMQAGVTKIIEESMLTREGKRIFLVVKAPLKDDQGNIIGTIGTSSDLTEQKKGIKSTEKLLESVIDSIAGNHWWKDKNGVYLGCNNAFIKTLGLSSHLEVIGKTDYELPWAETADVLIKNDKKVMELGVAQWGEELVASKRGETMTFMVAKAPLRDENGNIIGTVGNSIDITEQKKIERELLEAKEKAELANQAKSNFLAMISHELRTPLNGILGMADILSREKLTDQQKYYVKDIETSGKNLLAIVNEILDFSKMQAGKIELKLKPFNLRETVNDIITNIRHQLRNDAVKIIFNYSTKIPESIIGDQLRLMQVLLNLVGNAVKFTEEGYIKIEVEPYSKLNSSIILSFKVRDTGIGIPKDQQENIFERFTQVESDQYVRKHGGVGLGLAICKQLVTAMGGTIGVESEPGKGSTFYFVVPFNLIEEDNSVSTKRINQIQEATAQYKKFDLYLLLVEDEAINQRVISAMLKELGCRFDIAENGEQALKFLGKKKYDLILMDIRLPDSNGVTLTQKIRSLTDKTISSLPIIAMTAHALEEEVINFRTAGIDDVITKPVSLNSILGTFSKRFKN